MEKTWACFCLNFAPVPEFNFVTGPADGKYFVRHSYGSRGGERVSGEEGVTGSLSGSSVVLNCDLDTLFRRHDFLTQINSKYAEGGDGLEGASPLSIKQEVWRRLRTATCAS